MFRSRLARRLAVTVIVLAAPRLVRAETLYFKNMRTLEVESYEIKGALVWVTMADGRSYPMRGDSVDWEGTERLRQGGFQLEKVAYEIADAPEPGEEDEPIPGEDKPLTAADLRKVGKGLRLRRAAAPSLLVEVSAKAAWVDSGINVKQGQRLSIRASGEAVLGGGVSSGPRGLGNDSGRDALVTSLPRGVLLARVGLGGVAVPLGVKVRLRPRGAGRLYLAVNDSNAADNSGGYTVRVTLPRPPTASTGGTLSTGSTTRRPVSSTSSETDSPPPPPSRPVPRGQVGHVERSRRSLGGAPGR